MQLSHFESGASLHRQISALVCLFFGISEQGARRLISHPCQRSYGNQLEENWDANSCTCIKLSLKFERFLNGNWAKPETQQAESRILISSHFILSLRGVSKRVCVCVCVERLNRRKTSREIFIYISILTLMQGVTGVPGGRWPMKT